MKGCHPVERQNDPNTLEDLWPLYRDGKLGQSVTLADTSTAKAALLAFIDKTITNAKTAESYRNHVELLTAGHNGALIEKLPELVRRYREIAEHGKPSFKLVNDTPKLDDNGKQLRGANGKKLWNKKRVPVLDAAGNPVLTGVNAVQTFRVIRAVSLSYASHTYGKHSPLWNAIASNKVLKRTPGKVTKHNGEARTVANVKRVVDRMRQPYASYFWAMCITGMNTSEFFTHGWEILPDNAGVHVRGRKNDWRDRVVPIIQEISQPERSSQITNDWLKTAVSEVHAELSAAGDASADAFALPWQLTDGRRSFQYWIEEAGITQTRCDIYAGHKPQSMHQLYARHETAPYLDSDAQLLTEYIQRCLTATPVVRAKRVIPKNLI